VASEVEETLELELKFYECERDLRLASLGADTVVVNADYEHIKKELLERAGLA